MPVGYDAHPDRTRRELVVNEAEADTVKALFHLYEDHNCLNKVVQEAARRGLVSKRRTSPSGTISGGQPFSRGQLHHLLTNPTYLGRIRHKDKDFAGQHPAIISEDLWASVQTRLAARSARKRGQRADDSVPVALLSGLFRDEAGDRLTPSHSQKTGRRHHYYVSHRLIANGTDPTGWRLPARAFEALVAEIIATHLERASERCAILANPDPITALAVAKEVKTLVTKIRAAQHRPIAKLIADGQIARSRITLRLDADALAHALSVAVEALDANLLAIDAPFAIRRRGVETRLVSGSFRPTPDHTLIRALAQAHRWTEQLRQGISFTEIARRAGKHESLVRARAQLAFLAPSVQHRILEGTLPPDLTLERLVRMTLPLTWDEQVRVLGL